jgi:hypothetical protein
MVLLRHDVPDGTWHFDWMLDLGGDGDERSEGTHGTQGARGTGGLETFRVWERPERVPVGAAIRAERLGAHRREYLTFEGEISGGRGRVRRAATGRATRIEAGGSGMEFEAAFDGGTVGRWWARPRGRGGLGDWEITRIG